MLRIPDPRDSFLKPAKGLIAATVVLPFLVLLWLSFTNFGFGSASGSGSYVGLQNYVKGISDFQFHGSLLRAGEFAICATLSELVLALLIAEVVISGRRRHGWLAWLTLPAAISSVAVALFWRLLLHSQFGPIGYWAGQFGWHEGANLLGDAGTAFATLITVDVWQWTPLLALIFVVLRLTQTASIEDAARVDGAGPVTTYFTVTLGILGPWISLVGLLRFVEAFREFDKPHVLTSGGPGTSTELMSLYLWRVAFKDWDFGYAAALTVIVYGLLLTAVLVASVPATRKIDES